MQMAKIHIERAYIEPFDEEEPNFDILIHVKHENSHTFASKVELDRQIPWMHLANAKNGDLMINNSAGLEENKWEHVTNHILGEADERTKE